MMVLTAKRIAKPIVQRFRLRSTSEPPPSGPAPACPARSGARITARAAARASRISRTATGLMAALAGLRAPEFARDPCGVAGGRAAAGQVGRRPQADQPADDHDDAAEPDPAD